MRASRRDMSETQSRHVGHPVRRFHGPPFKARARVTCIPPQGSLQPRAAWRWRGTRLRPRYRRHTRTLPRAPDLAAAAGSARTMAEFDSDVGPGTHDERAITRRPAACGRGDTHGRFTRGRPIPARDGRALYPPAVAARKAGPQRLIPPRPTASATASSGREGCLPSLVPVRLSRGFDAARPALLEPVCSTGGPGPTMGHVPGLDGSTRAGPARRAVGGHSGASAHRSDTSARRRYLTAAVPPPPPPPPPTAAHEAHSVRRGRRTAARKRGGSALKGEAGALAAGRTALLQGLINPNQSLLRVPRFIRINSALAAGRTARAVVRRRRKKVRAAPGVTAAGGLTRLAVTWGTGTAGCDPIWRTEKSAGRLGMLFGPAGRLCGAARRSARTRRLAGLARPSHVLPPRPGAAQAGRPNACEAYGAGRTRGHVEDTYLP